MRSITYNENPKQHNVKTLEARSCSHTLVVGPPMRRTFFLLLFFFSIIGISSDDYKRITKAGETLPNTIGIHKTKHPSNLPTSVGLAMAALLSLTLPLLLSKLQRMITPTPYNGFSFYSILLSKGHIPPKHLG